MLIYNLVKLCYSKALAYTTVDELRAYNILLSPLTLVLYQPTASFCVLYYLSGRGLYALVLCVYKSITNP